MRTQLAEAENLVSRIQNEINVMDVLNHVASRSLPISNSDVDLITKILGDENNSIESKKNCLIYLAKIVQNRQVLEVSAIDKISDFIGSILSEQAISIFYYTKDSNKFSSTVINKIRNELKKNTVEDLIPGSNTQYNYRLNQINKRYDQAMKNQHKA